MPVRFEMAGDVGVIILASPEKRNALSREIVHGVLDILTSERHARALVITGEGPAFCAGADIGDLLTAGWMDPGAEGPTPIDLFEALDKDPRIVVAAVNGMALGGGFELALSCDLAIACPEAVFAMPELEHGVIPNTALSRLSQLVGRRVTLELAATGRRLAASEAASHGIVNFVVPRSILRHSAVALAADIVRRAPPGALAALKRGLGAAAPVDWSEVRGALGRIPPAEWQEGLGAFGRRAKPDYEQFWSSDAHRRSIQDL